MKIVVFAAAGKVGQEVVRASLAKGYEVVAVVRTNQTLPFTDVRVTVAQAELSDTEALEKALVGADAVITAFGPGPTTHDTALSDGTKNILDAMEKVGVKRIVLLSTNAVGDEGDNLDIPWEILKWIIKTGAPGATNEILRMAEHARASSRDYTLVRIPFLTEAPKKKSIRFGYLGHGAIGWNITRADLAEFMVEQVSNPSYIRRAISVSN